MSIDMAQMNLIMILVCICVGEIDSTELKNMCLETYLC